VEDVNHAGGIFTILGALDRAGLMHRDVATVHAPTLGAAIDANDIRRKSAGNDAARRTLTAPGGVRTTVAFSQDKYYAEPDTDGKTGCIREVEHAYSKDGGLAVLYGNLAEEGCIVRPPASTNRSGASKGPRASSTRRKKRAPRSWRMR